MNEQYRFVLTVVSPPRVMARVRVRVRLNNAQYHRHHKECSRAEQILHDLEWPFRDGHGLAQYTGWIGGWVGLGRFLEFSWVGSREFVMGGSTPVWCFFSPRAKLCSVNIWRISAVMSMILHLTLHILFVHYMAWPTGTWLNLPPQCVAKPSVKPARRRSIAP